MKPPKEYLKNLKHHTITEKMLSDCIYSINNRALNSRDNEYKYTHYIPNTYGKGYSKGFVPCNARGTNEFKDKKALAYLVNFFMSPEIRQFVNHYDLIFDEDMCSLSALLQWMWRSQIRNGKPIDIYIPSERMRELLNNWIQNCYVTEKAA